MRTLMCFIVVTFFLFFQKSLTAQNVSPQFSELKGMEDTQGNAHLFYRIHSYEELEPFGFYEDNSIYHLDLSNHADSLFLKEFGSNMLGYHFVNDFRVIDLSPMEYIYVRTSCPFECNPLAYNSKYGIIFGNGSWGSSYKIAVGQNPDLIYYGLDAWDMDTSITTLCSKDGGQNWDTLSSSKVFLSLNQFDNRSSFYSDIWSSAIYKSSDGGGTFYLADTTKAFLNPTPPEFYYDADQTHIYKTAIKGGQTLQYYFSVSDNYGEPFSWQIKYQSQNRFYISIDESQSGAIYLADGKRIFYSSDYGTTFNLYKELDKRSIGIYKKPNSDKLYAATKYRIFEITSDTITVIKSLPIPDELLSFYPLKIGNKWVYERIDYSVDWFTGTIIIDTSYFHRKVSGLQTLPNNIQYYKIEDYDFYQYQSKISFERIDSLTGIVYRYDESLDSMNFEFVIDNLMAEYGEEIISSRLYSYYSPQSMVFSTEDYFNDFGLYRKRNGYSGGYWGSEYYSLVSGIGLDSVFVSLIDAYDAHINLKGCVIDGIVYGDTTLTDVENESELPKEFSLSQNYPNPFNPSTKISWQTPVGGWQTLKVYDVLGNEIATLVDEYKPAGKYEIELKSSVGSLQLASGIYFYQLRAGDPSTSSGQSFAETKKMILIK